MEDFKKSLQNTCPMPASVTLQKYFAENRSRLLDIAAYLDRIDRSKSPLSVANDFRLQAFRQALEALLNSSENRVEKVHQILSDPTTEPISSPDGIKSAFGAFQQRTKTDCC